MFPLSLKQWVIVGACVLVGSALCYGSYNYGGKASTEAATKELEAVRTLYQNEIAAKDVLIEQKDAALKASETRYASLKASLGQKKEEAAAIKAPATNEELRRRYEDLGFTPR